MEHPSEHTETIRPSPERQEASAILYSLLQDPHQEHADSLFQRFTELNTSMQKSIHYFIETTKTSLQDLEAMIQKNI